MWWLAVLVLVAIVLTPAQFRKFFLALVALSLVLGTSVYFYNQHSREKTLALIAPEEVALEELVLDTSFGTYLKGRLRNESEEHVLREVVVRVRVYDCTSPGLSPECPLLSTQEVSLYGPVRPGGSKPFSTNMVLPPLKGGYPGVRYEIVSIKGK
jgi:hypothetical protein